MPMELAAPVGQYIAGRGAAESAGQMAQAQSGAELQAAQDTRNQAMGYVGQAQGFAQQGINASMPTAQELAMLSAQQGASERATARQEALFASIDPAIMEAGKQALALMQGQSSPLLNPMLQERQRERAALQSKLQSQLGSAYASSSAGSEALNRFDQQTSQNAVAVQQQTLGQLMGQAQSGVGMSAQANAQTTGFYNSALGNAGNLQQRQMGAYGNAAQTAMGGANAIMGTNYSQQAGAAAGAPYIRDYANAQNMGALFGNVGKSYSQIQGQIVGASMGKPQKANQGLPGGENSYSNQQSADAFNAQGIA